MVELKSTALDGGINSINTLCSAGLHCLKGSSGLVSLAQSTLNPNLPCNSDLRSFSLKTTCEKNDKNILTFLKNV